jgi:hypothetical protein
MVLLKQDGLARVQAPGPSRRPAYLTKGAPRWQAPEVAGRRPAKGFEGPGAIAGA